MKTLLLPLSLALALTAQDQAISVVIAPQGKEAVSLATGYRPKRAALARVDACNDGTEDRNLSTARLIAAVELTQGAAVYSAEVVDAVLQALQQRDVFTRASKAVQAATSTATLLTALFRTFTPTTVALLEAAPAIAAVILPAVGDPRDLAALGKRIVPDNSSWTLSKAGSGNDCHTGLMVMVAGEVPVKGFSIR